MSQELLQAKVKDSNKRGTIIAFGGKVFVKGTWNIVPEDLAFEKDNHKTDLEFRTGKAVAPPPPPEIEWEDDSGKVTKEAAPPKAKAKAKKKKAPIKVVK